MASDLLPLIFAAALMTCKAGSFCALQSCLTGLKNALWLRRRVFLALSLIALSPLFLTEILDERNITRADRRERRILYNQQYGER